MVLRAVICSSVFLLILALASCTNGPVPVRDTVTTPAPERPATRNTPEAQPQKQPDLAPPIAEPRSAPVPLSSKLRQQAEQSLQFHRWDQAILFAERGLRINRKEPFFYWVLSTAYQKLSRIKQSIDFARQGLRYASVNSGLRIKLADLAAQ